MARIRNKAMVAVTSAAIVILVMAGTAAASNPPYEPDGNSVGGLIFYNAAGAEVTSGSISSSPFAAFVQATSPGRAGDDKATLYEYTPVNGVPSGSWSGAQFGASPSYPNTSAPTTALSTTSLPVYTAASADSTLVSLESQFPNNDTSSDGYAGLYEIRLYTSGPGQSRGSSYDSADIVVTGTTWTEVYSADAVTATTTALGVQPGSPQTVGTFGGTQSITLSATVTPPSAVGSVQFVDGPTNLGSRCR